MSRTTRTKLAGTKLVGTNLNASGTSVRSSAIALAMVTGGMFICAGLLSGLAGCSSTTNYPEIENTKLTFEDPNEWRTVAAMIVAARYVGTRYVPGEGPRFETADPNDVAEPKVAYPMVLNAPPGLRRTYYSRLCREVGASVEPMSESVANAIDAGEETQIPVFHIGRVWIREQRAEIDVYRPMPELGRGTDGKQIYQMVTVRMTGGFQPWRAIHGRAWAPGAFPTPFAYVIPEVDRSDQYKVSKRELEAKGLTVPTPPEIDQPSIEKMPEGLNPIEKF